MERPNCWEVKKCGRTIKDEKPCPAATENKLHGTHGGTNAGRACWVIAGTFCGGEEQGTFAAKYQNCEKCDFYHRVKQEEGATYHLSITLLSMMRNNI